MQQHKKLLSNYKFHIKDTWWFYPELASVLPNGNFTEEEYKVLLKAAKDYIETYKKYAFKRDYNTLSLVTTGYCKGCCSYCYAKDYYKETDYIQPESIKQALDKYNFKLVDRSEVVLYGGEPVANFLALEKLVSFLYAYGFKKVHIVTGLFYEEEIYKKLQKLLDFYPSLLLTTSLDNFSKNYARKYENKDAYSFAKNRYIELNSKYPNRIGIRATITNPVEYLSWLEEMEKEVGKDFSCRGVFVHGYPKEDFIYFTKKWFEHFKGKENYFNYKAQFFRFEQMHTFLEMLKGCDSNIGRLILNYKGEKINCVESFHDTTKIDIFDTSCSSCKGCKFYPICLRHCFNNEDIANCYFEISTLLHWMKTQPIDVLRKKSIIEACIK